MACGTGGAVGSCLDQDPLYNAVPRRRDSRKGVTIALVVILSACVGCGLLGSIGGFFALRSVGEALPTIQAGIAATLTATAGPPVAANDRPARTPQPVNTTPRPTNTLAPTVTPRPTQTPSPVRPTSTPLPKPEVALQQVGYYRDTWDELWFMGELLNSSALEAGDFRITVELIGAQGQVVASGKLDPTEIGVAALKPGAKTVWHVKIPDAPRQWQTERIEATTGPVIIGRGQSPYLELEGRWGAILAAHQTLQSRNRQRLPGKYRDINCARRARETRALRRRGQADPRD